MNDLTDRVVPVQITQRYLERFLWLSLFTALATVTIKASAAWLTNSVGLWSDALESCVNLVAAIVALWAIRLSAKPADHNHDFGHGKAEYLSAAVEGILILAAAVAIIYSAAERLIRPTPIEQLGLGLALSLIATLLNLGTGLLLMRTGKAHRSITLEADGKHLLTDVWTSGGVLVAIGLVAVTGWSALDPLIAIAVGLNILLTGFRLIRRSAVGLLDAALPTEDVASVQAAIKDVCYPRGVDVAQLRTRESGRQRFVYATIRTPDHWSVEEGHDTADAVEEAVSGALPGTTTFVHVEPQSNGDHLGRGSVVDV